MNLNNRIKISFAVILIVLNTLLFQTLHGQIIPYKNSKLKVEERVDDLIQRMTIEEKVKQMLKLTLVNLKQDKKGR
jgi:beta-glucosidase